MLNCREFRVCEKFTHTDRRTRHPHFRFSSSHSPTVYSANHRNTKVTLMREQKEWCLSVQCVSGFLLSAKQSLSKNVHHLKIQVHEHAVLALSPVTQITQRVHNASMYIFSFSYFAYTYNYVYDSIIFLMSVCLWWIKNGIFTFMLMLSCGK